MMNRFNTTANGGANLNRTEYIDADAFCSLMISPRRLSRLAGPTSATRALRDAESGVTFVIRKNDLEDYLSKRRGTAMA